tara:strand:+ start:111 stop:1328 length:1218 start_codon:yes stop_codon:yes gene_type:complete
MLTIRATWNALSGDWEVNELGEDAHLAFDPAVSLSEWAEAKPDLTQVRILLSAMNYSCHWISMPGVSNRNLSKALPFALEEHLLEELDHYQIVSAGKSGSMVRAYVVSAELIERLMETCSAHHLIVKQLLPETALLPKGSVIVRDGDDWLFSLPGKLEGRVSDIALTAVLESTLEEQTSDQPLEVRAPTLDQARLLTTSLETGFPEAFSEINSVLGSSSALFSENAAAPSLPNLLSGQFQQRDREENKPKAWWRPLAAMAAAWLVILAGYLVLENRQLEQRSLEVRKQSIALYKQLFPGERIRMLERQFRSKLNDESPVAAVGFVALVNGTAKAYSASGLKTLDITSIRYNDRLQELMVEVKATNLNDVQALRQALEKQGLEAEVASASNEKNGVKGRLKVGVSA